MTKYFLKIIFIQSKLESLKQQGLEGVQIIKIAKMKSTLGVKPLT